MTDIHCAHHGDFRTEDSGMRGRQISGMVCSTWKRVTLLQRNTPGAVEETPKKAKSSYHVTLRKPYLLFSNSFLYPP